MRNIKLLILLMIFLLPIINAQQTINDAGITPDSFLWGLDNALDQLNLFLSFDKGEKVRKGLEIARERLLEVKDMVSENKLDAAEKSRKGHEETLLKVKENIKEIEEEPEKEINKIIEIEKEVEEHSEEVEETLKELRIKIKIEGEISQEQKELIDSILNGLKGKIGEVEIEIKNKKDQTKIKIKQETSKTEEEIESEVEKIEKEKGIKKEEKALEAIEEAREEFNEFLNEAKEKNIVVSQDLLNKFNSLLAKAEDEFKNGNFVEAKNLAKQAEELLEEEIEEEKEIEVEIEEEKTKVKVEIQGNELEFNLDTKDLDEIINEISIRTGLSKEEISKIIKIEDEENKEKGIKEEKVREDNKELKRVEENDKEDEIESEREEEKIEEKED